MSSFQAPETLSVLSMHRLLLKVVGAKDLPKSTSAQRRNCSAEVQLVNSGGGPLDGNPLHSRTGPPNQFSTVKDTAPVWNAEFVAEVSESILRGGARLRVDVWDDATSPPVHLGHAVLDEVALRELCNRDEERTLALERGGVHGGAKSGAVRVRVAHVDVRRALAMLPQAEASAAQA